MSEIDPDKLKVTELRDELKARGLDTKGVKAVLVQRLKEALESEGATGAGGGEGGGDEEQEDFQVVEAVDDEEEGGGDAEAEAEEEAEETAPPEDETPAEEEAPVDEEAVAEEAPAEEEALGEEDAPEEEEAPAEDETPAEETAQESASAEDAAAAAESSEAALEANGEGAADEAAVEGEEDVEMPDELGDEFKTIDEATEGDDRDSRKRRRSRSRSRSRERHRGHRSRSRSRERRRSRSPPPRKVEMDDCSWESCTSFQIDRYNCDLNLRVREDGLKAHPLTVEGFAFMWSGARAMYGVKSGKVAYEVKLLENLSVDHLPSDEVNPHVLRVGWSADDTSMQLGEEQLSFGYGGTGKASTECQFKDYGESFTAGDVVTAYLDMDSDPVTISYAKNGNDLGVCFEVEKEKLEDRALFPHILTKNTEYELNFGAKEEPYFPLKEGYVFLESISQEERVRGSLPPATKEDCEVIMMVGLPGAGKTVWAEKHSIGNLDKKFNVLGTNNIIDKMKVMGLPRKKNYTGRWDVLIDKSTKCLNRMIEIAARKKRNYILDQTNVYASARRRKMQPFEGFQRKAVIVVPTDEEYKSRFEKSVKEEGKDVPEKAVLEMKANFTLPEVGQLFDSVEYTEEAELSKEEAEKLVAKYKEEASKLLPPPEKRFRESRFSDYSPDRGRRDFRDNRGRGGYRGGFDRDRRGGGGNWRGPRGGGYDRNRGGGRYGDNRRFDDRRSYGSSGKSYGGGYQGNQRSGGYGSGYNKGWGNQQGSWGQGGWGQQQYGNQSGYGNRSYGQWPQQSSWGQGYWGQSGGYGSGYGSNQGWGSYGNYQSYGGR